MKHPQFDLADFVRAGYESFNTDRVPSLDFWHADGEYAAAREDPDSETHRGIEAVRKQFARWVESYPDMRVDLLEIRTNGDRAFAWVRMSGRGAGSGVSIEMELAHVWTVEDGKIRRIAEYFDRAEGLEAAGLR